MRLGDFATLWRLARRRQDSEADYRTFQAFQATLLLDHLSALGVRLEGRTDLVERSLDSFSHVGLSFRGAVVTRRPH